MSARAKRWDEPPPCPNCGATRIITRMWRWPWRKGTWWRCFGCFSKWRHDQ